ncbi:Uncharacterized protein TCM_032624 [Theobroma cacao]|uniref:Uncharacterized protein n=1 Tax=Theobroma cacao TaxID=3641 RepID=A0A061FHE9_THECC|nr:Uncharacterized protein TCM_032624 [Theobroma cacao]
MLCLILKKVGLCLIHERLGSIKLTLSCCQNFIVCMASTDSIISISSIRKGSAHSGASRRTLQVTEKDNEWFIEIRDAFNPDLESDYEMPMPVCICLVPKPLVHVKPEAYTPQLIALGLYNHFQPELYEMEHYKLAAVKRAITPVFQLSVFENLIEEIVTQVPYICKCSRGLTAPNHDIISWIMAVDGLFLLDLLNTFTNRGEISQQSTGKKQPEAYTLLKGVLKLENQIPIGVLLLDRWTKSWSTDLLDLLYHSITFKKDNGETHPDGLTKERSCLPSEASPPIGGPITCAVFSDLLNMLSSLKLGKVFKLITKFCPTDGGTANVRFDGNTKTFYLPVITLKHTSEVVMRNLVVYETMAKSKTKSLNFKRYTELMSAIVDTIEDVELLKKARVLTTVPNKQKEEAKALESDILSDAEIVETFNEMTKTMESKDWFIDEAIREANKCYNNTEKVKAYRLMKKHIYTSWKILTLFASLLISLLMALQTVCDVYSCPGLFHTIKKT